MKVFTSLAVLLLTAVSSLKVRADTAVPYTRLNKNDTALLIVDQQVGLAAAVRDWDATIFKNNILAHAAIGKVYNIPTILTTSVEFGPNGPLPKEILEMYPDAPLIKRPGEVNAWDNPGYVVHFRAAVKATGKHQFVIAGITTDVCVAFLALSLRAEGYHVAVNLEASGTFNTRVGDRAMDRMQAAGVQIMNFFSINAELFRDWRSTDPSAATVVPYLDHYLAEESFVVRAHGAAVAQSGSLVPGENETITVRQGDPEVFY